MEKILWVKFGWAPFYQGDQVIGNYSWNTKEGGEFHEAFNFSLGPHDKYYCYVPPHGKGKNSPTSLDPHGWTVICFAKQEKRNGVHIVGWYENATLKGCEVRRPEYDEPEGFRLDNQDAKFTYTVEAEAAFLVPQEYRINPIIHKSIGMASFSYIRSPDKRMIETDAKTEVLNYIERELVRLRPLAISQPTIEKVSRYSAAAIATKRATVSKNDPASARKRSILTMADNAATAASASGKEVTSIVKEKRLFHTRTELEAIIDRLIEEQDQNCALSGLPLQWLGSSDDDAMLASLDRIDSNGHYKDGNLQIVCRFVNLWKSNSPDDEFRRLLRIIKTSPA